MIGRKRKLGTRQDGDLMSVGMYLVMNEDEDENRIELN